MPVVTYLQPRVQFLARFPLAVAEAPMVVSHNAESRGIKYGGVLVEIELLEAVVTVRHDHDRRRRLN
jgi:hypothetical protein